MACLECKERLYPSDPSKDFCHINGHYVPPTCYYCPNYDLEPVVEQNQQPQVVNHYHFKFYQQPDKKTTKDII